MNPRERILAVVLLLLIVVVGGGFLGYLFFRTPLREKEARLATLTQDVEKSETQLRQVQQDLPKLTRWQQISLPGDLDLARREYERFLTEMLRESGFAPGSYTVISPKTTEVKTSAAAAKKSPYTALTFKVQAPANLGQFVTFLERFYHTTLLHQIKNLVLKRDTNSTRSGQLLVDLTIEALVLTGTQGKVRPVAYAVLGTAAWASRTANRLGTNGLAVPPRDYREIADHNIFLGPPVVAAAEPVVTDRTEYTRMIFLTGITLGSDQSEASLFYRYNNRRQTVRPERGQDRFPILQDSRGRTLVEGVVKRLDERDLVFQVQMAVTEEATFPRRPDAERWNRPDKITADALVKAEAVKTEELDRVYQIGRAYWDLLDREGLVTVRENAFAFKWDLVKGRVLSTDDRTVVIHLDEKYCAYAGLAQGAGNPFRRRRVEPHAGYFACHVGENLDEALTTPLPQDKVNELLKTAAAPGPDKSAEDQP
jgi:hypothetical protein